MLEKRASTPFAVIPAIDLRGGRVVRLTQGDFDRERVYEDDPVTVARTFARAGATWIHLVDLDGARTGAPRQGPILAAIRRALADDARAGRRRTSLQVAGGLRTRDAIESALDGADRVVIGTAALAAPSLVRAMVDRHGSDRIAAALDVRDGLAVGEGWRTGAAGRPVQEALGELLEVGVRTFVATAIARDGLLGGPDLDLLQDCVRAAPTARIVASGGVTTIDDLRAVRDLGCAGAICGRAILDGRLDLAEAIAAVSG